MKVLLTPIRAYEVRAADGRLLGEFKSESRWEGLEKLKSGTGGVLFIEEPSGIAESFRSIFGTGPIECDVVRGSPSVLADLAPKAGGQEA